MLPLETETAVRTSLALYTSPGLIIPRLREADTPGIINELSLHLQREGGVGDILPFYHTALNQELLGNSALECGIALPHARLSSVKRLQFSFGRTAKPVAWGPKHSWPVDLIFLLAVPATDAASYLHLLSAVARLGQNSKRLAELRAAGSGEEILQVLEQVPIRERHRPL